MTGPVIGPATEVVQRIVGVFGTSYCSSDRGLSLHTLLDVFGFGVGRREF